jgi:hypothetical protein
MTYDMQNKPRQYTLHQTHTHTNTHTHTHTHIHARGINYTHTARALTGHNNCKIHNGQE